MWSGGMTCRKKVGHGWGSWCHRWTGGNPRWEMCGGGGGAKERIRSSRRLTVGKINIRHGWWTSRWIDVESRNQRNRMEIWRRFLEKRSRRSILLTRHHRWRWRSVDHRMRRRLKSEKKPPLRFEGLRRLTIMTIGLCPGRNLNDPDEWVKTSENKRNKLCWKRVVDDRRLTCFSN